MITLRFTKVILKYYDDTQQRAYFRRSQAAIQNLKTSSWKMMKILTKSPLNFVLLNGFVLFFRYPSHTGLLSLAIPPCVRVVYWRWSRSPLGKKRRVLHISRSCNTRTTCLLAYSVKGGGHYAAGNLANVVVC